MNPGEFLVEGRGLVFGGLKPEDLGQPAGLDYRPVFLGDQRVGRVEEMLVDAVVQDAPGLADVVKLVVARVDQAVDQVGRGRHASFISPWRGAVKIPCDAWSAWLARIGCGRGRVAPCPDGHPSWAVIGSPACTASSS